MSQLTPEQKASLLKLAENPPRGSKLSIARNHGVDLHQLVENLSLTPTERARKFEEQVNKMLDRARRKRLRKAQRQKKQNASI